MTKSRFERGAIVRCNHQTWIVWGYPRGRAVEPIAFCVAPQTAPLHRSHVRLRSTLWKSGSMWKRDVIVDTRKLCSLPENSCEKIGQCDEETIGLIADTMRRAVAARDLEMSACGD